MRTSPHTCGFSHDQRIQNYSVLLEPSESERFGDLLSRLNEKATIKEKFLDRSGLIREHLSGEGYHTAPAKLVWSGGLRKNGKQQKAKKGDDVNCNPIVQPHRERC